MKCSKLLTHPRSTKEYKLLSLQCLVRRKPRAANSLTFAPSMHVTMPRLPLTFLCRVQGTALTLPPSQLTRAYLPRLSALEQTFPSVSSRCFTATSRSLDSYIPTRIPNAAWPYIYKQLDKMAELDAYFKQVDTLQDSFIERLREAVAIPSISSEDQRRPDVIKVGRSAQCEKFIS